MFTGLIEAVGKVLELKPTPAGARLRLEATLAAEMSEGDSLAVNGVCLTLIAVSKGEVYAELGPETLRVSTLGSVQPGALVNLERPLRADSRLGGHFVQGHVDDMGSIEDIRSDGAFFWITVSFSELLRPYIIHRGSIAVDGVSLTVAGLGHNQFDVQVVPYTWEHTNLRSRQKSDRVNLECDILGKYVVRAAEIMSFSRDSGAGRAH